jgi:hypothetical protein
VRQDDADIVQIGGDVRVNGVIRANDFITLSKVADVEEKALSKIENLSEWKNVKGEIDYEKHYAYVEREVDGVTERGLSMEGRIASMEKMIYELYQLNKSLVDEIKELKNKS